jgi:mono/diheme cytochrome c family protein
MKSTTIKTLALGALAGYLLAALVLIALAELGVMPVQADVAPGQVETYLFGSALQASVARRASRSGNPIPASEDNLAAGAKLYRQMCSRCHGASADSDNVYGRSFFPPAPSLALARTSYTEGEMFWIIKHGIRNTAMPAWSNLLSDDEIWQVVAVLRKPLETF